jgi:hypothetical protein
MQSNKHIYVAEQRRIIHLSLSRLLPVKLRMWMWQSCQYLAFLEKTMFQQRKCGISWNRWAFLPFFSISGLDDFSFKLFCEKQLFLMTPSFLWFCFLYIIFQNGHFDQENFNAGPSMPSSPGQKLCAAVSASTWVEPHGRCTVVFGLSWSSPKVKFQKGYTYNRLVFPFFNQNMQHLWFVYHMVKHLIALLSHLTLPL